MSDELQTRPCPACGFDNIATRFTCMRCKKPLKEVKFPQGAIIGAVVRHQEVVIPRGDDVVSAGDHVIVFTLQKAIRKVERAMSVKLEFF